MDIKNMDNLDQKDPKIYEIGYFLVPMIAEDDKLEVVKKEIISLIEKHNGEVLAQTTPMLRPLAYPIRKMIQNNYSKFKDGYFGAIKFSVLPQAVVEMNDVLRRSESIIRFLLVESNPEAKVIEPVVLPTDATQAVLETVNDEGEVVAVDEAELDKEINDLLV